MKHLTEYKGYQLFQADNGIIELWKGVGKYTIDGNGKITHARSDRVVTNATSKEEAFKYIDRLKKRKPKPKEYDPYSDPDQLRIE